MEPILHIRKFVRVNFGHVQNEIADDTPLLEAGVIDSTGVTELIFFVEEQFRFEVLPEEVLPENFNSIANIAAYVERRLA